MGSALIFTNGDSTVDLLQAAGIGDVIMPWRDCLHEGPVPEAKSLSALSTMRADYLSMAGHGAIDEIKADFKERDDLLARNQAFDDVTLWFEHDLYDQLQLLQILAWFADHWRDDGRVFLVQADDYLGMQTPQTIGRFADKSAPVSGLQLSMAKIAWAAFCHDTPEAWARLLNEDLDALPFLHDAVARMAQELPDVGTGLSRTQQQIIRVIDAGAQKPGLSFAAYLATEDAKFLGDTGYFRLLDGLAFCQTPLIAKAENRKLKSLNWRDTAQRKLYFQDQLTLTPFGKDVLAGRADHAGANSLDHWWGGTHLTNDNMWRWDRTADLLVPPLQNGPG